MGYVGNAGKGRKWMFLLVLIVIIICIVHRDAITGKIREWANRINTIVKEVAKGDGEEQVEEKKQTRFSAKKTSVDITEETLSIINIIADSTLISSKGKEYYAEYMVDGDTTTSWQEGADDFGENNSIEITFAQKAILRYMVIYNGNQASEDLFKSNNRVRSIEIKIGDEKTGVELEDSMTPQIIELQGIDEVEKVTVIIKSVYPGSRWDDTCISEIACYKK